MSGGSGDDEPAIKEALGINAEIMQLEVLVDQAEDFNKKIMTSTEQAKALKNDTTTTPQ